jgi:uncharacterized membrane protein YfcA
MTFLVGFVIACGVGLTGVGAGAVTAPVLILFFGLPAATSVGTALAFAAVIKLAVAPMYLLRKQVNLRILTLLASGGIPGVLIGVLLVSELNARRYERTLLVLVGGTIVLMALYSLYRSIQKNRPAAGRDHSKWLPPIALGIGTEVGFSSAGAGALGSLVLLNLTTLTPAQVVGTDMLFGLVVSIIGGGFHVFGGHYDSALLPKLLIGGVAGAFVGANLSTILPARPLRIALSLCLVGLGVQLCCRGVF